MKARCKLTAEVRRHLWKNTRSQFSSSTSRASASAARPLHSLSLNSQQEKSRTEDSRRRRLASCFQPIHATGVPSIRWISNFNNDGKDPTKDGEDHGQEKYQDDFETFADDDDDDDDDDDLTFENFEDPDDGDHDDEEYGALLDYDISNNNNNNNNNYKSGRDEKGDDFNRRIYLDPHSPLEERVDRFLNRRLGELHPLDIAVSSVDLIRECGKRRSFEGMKFAHDILDRLLEEKHYFNQLRSKDGTPPPYTIVIPERTFVVLMYGWSNLCRKVPVAPKRMREILDLMIQESEYDEALKMERKKEGAPIPENVQVQGKKHNEVDPAEMFANMSCQPTVGIYNTLLNGLAQASYRSFACAGEAEDTLRLMERIAKRRGWHVKPNTKSFMEVINAFARTQRPKAGERAEAVLRRMIRFHEQEVAIYHKETGFEYDPTEPTNNTRRIVTPDAIAYTAVIQAYCESGGKGSAERALALLTELLKSSDSNLAPDAYAFSATINAFAKRAAKVKTRPARLEAAKAAESVLWLMVDTILIQGSKADKNNENAYVVPFNTCLNAWASANLRESPNRAEAILQKMLDPEMSAKTGVKPTAVTFNTCMQAWARSARRDPEAPRNAEDLLQLMEQVDSVEADVRSYTTIINAYAKSLRPDKAVQARRVLEALLSNLSTMPARHIISAVPFTVVLNAVASSNTANRQKKASESESDPFGVNEEALFENEDGPYSIALKTYDEVNSDLYDLGITPDHLLFSTMIDTVAAYTSSDSIERRQRLEKIFQDACTAGSVSSMVVQALANACPSIEMLKTMLQLRTWPVESVNALPREWVRKVPPKFKKMKSNDDSSSANTTSFNGGKKKQETRRKSDGKQNQR